MTRKRWKTRPANRYVENQKIDAFLDEVESVCERHGLSLAHEDGHGAFLVVDYNDGRAGDLESAHDATGMGKRLMTRRSERDVTADWTREPIAPAEAKAGLRALDFIGLHDLTPEEMKALVALIGKLQALGEGR